MKKIQLVLFAILISLATLAQEKQKEIGLAFRSFDNFGLTYKTGTSKSMWRFNTLLASGSDLTRKQDSLQVVNSSFTIGFKIGKEFRKPLLESFEIRYGFDLLFDFNRSKYKYSSLKDPARDNETESTNYMPGIGAVFGFNYLINKSLVLGLEVLPSVRYQIGKSTSENSSGKEVQDSKGFVYTLSNSSALLTLSYRF